MSSDSNTIPINPTMRAIIKRTEIPSNMQGVCTANFTCCSAQITIIHQFVVSQAAMESMAVNKNAVILDDIEPWWLTLDEHIQQSRPLKKFHNHDPADLDFSAMHVEAQKFNDLSDMNRNLDVFFLKHLQQHIVTYLKKSWVDLLPHERQELIHFPQQCEQLTLFDQLSWFGYDCLLRHNNIDLQNVAEYSKILGLQAFPRQERAAEMVVDFGVKFNFSGNIIAACNKHFQHAVRGRMEYTNFFNKKRV